MNLQQQWIAYTTIVRREVTRFMRIWMQTILPPVITMSLYFVIFGELIGPRIGTMDGYTYIDYIVPGLIMLSVITNSYANVVSSFYSSKFQKNIEEMLVSPVSKIVIIAGFITGGVCRGLLVGIVVTAVALTFTDLTIHNYSVTITVVLLTSLLFSLAGLINGIFANSFDDISIVPTFVLTPLTYLGGVFYSVSLLTPFWQAVSLGNPILYMVNAFRYGILGTSDITLFVSYALLLAFVTALFVGCWFLFEKGVGVKN